MRKQWTIEDMHAIAAERGAECLSTEYVNLVTPLEWKCGDCGHAWSGYPGNIVRKMNPTWCPVCAAKKRGDKRRNVTLEEMQEIAAKHGGWCLSSEEDVGTDRDHLTWKCANPDHEPWPATPNNIRRDKWCRKCAIEKNADRQRGTIEEMHELAESRGFKCLSTEYKSRHSKLDWQCQDGHVWPATPRNIELGKGCPHCKSYFPREELCRAIFEQAFGEKFQSRYPKWLKNDAGNKMQLDGYCEELSLAFEHHGKQHYEEVDYWDMDLDQRKKDDARKRQVCADHGTILIEVPFSVASEDLTSFIEQRCIEMDAPVAKIGFDKVSIKAHEVVASRMDELRELVQSRGGKVISDAFAFGREKMTFECEHGHSWSAVPADIRGGSWCHTCWHVNKPKWRNFEDTIAECLENYQTYADCHYTKPYWWLQKQPDGLKKLKQAFIDAGRPLKP